MYFAAETPFMSTGKIVGDYRLLNEYVKLLKNYGYNVEAFFPINDAFREVVRLVKDLGVRNLHEVISKVSEVIKPKINTRAGLEAFKRIYEIEVDEEFAAKKIAEIIVGYAIELTDSLGILRVNLG